jgi:UDP-N-acetyl-D-glucosamine/UDP-N-acetyl-D-galactosamine dehydrogenase
MKRKISVIGLGYVGLPVAAAFGRQVPVIGFDISESRIDELKKGQDSTKELETEELMAANIHYTSNFEDLKEANFHIIAVPTPVNKLKQPNLAPLLRAFKTVGSILKPGDIVVNESTVYPGCTDEECVPLLESESGLKINSDFGVGYSPERINPGDREHTFTKIQKVVSGSSQEVLSIVAETYASVVKAGVYQASSLKVAEAAKVIENAQRDINIAFVNELAMIFNRLGIDTHEVLKAAETKWNFLPFRPGLVGGHCIGVDPYYLTYKAECVGYNPQVILAGRRINDNMSDYIVQQTLKTLASANLSTLGAKVTVLGLTFKEDCPDLRNSQIPKIITELRSFGCDIQVHDPVCEPSEALKEYGITLTKKSNIQPAHAVLLLVAHKFYRIWTVQNWETLLLPNGILVDAKNTAPVNELKQSGHRVWKL